MCHRVHRLHALLLTEGKVCSWWAGIGSAGSECAIYFKLFQKHSVAVLSLDIYDVRTCIGCVKNCAQAEETGPGVIRLAVVLAALTWGSSVESGMRI